MCTYVREGEKQIVQVVPSCESPWSVMDGPVTSSLTKKA